MLIQERVLLRDEIRLQELLDTIGQGGVMIYPTETVYSIGGALSSARATETIFSLKERDLGAPLNTIVFDLRQAEAFAVLRYDLESRLFQEFGAQGLTLVLDARSFVAEKPRAGLPTIGVRLAVTTLTKLLTQRVAEPLTSVAAAAAVKPTQTEMDAGTSLAAIPETLKEQVDYVIEAEFSPAGMPSTIVRVEGEDRIVLIREGVLPLREIKRLVHSVEISEKTG